MAGADQQMTATDSEDLLSRFLSNKDPESFRNNDHAVVELTLGLSLNGRFGTEPRAKNDNDTHSLKCSSSISDFFTSTEQLGHVSEALGRTCSPPVETEEEWRRRKEILSLRRLKAKRKRSDKQRNTSSSSINNNNNSCRVSRLVVEAPLFAGSPPKDDVLPSQMSFRLSAGSHGTESSGLSESDSLTAEGGGRKSWEASVHSSCKGALRRNVLEEMPCVSTAGVGPNGKRVEGFLYRYSKREEVRIVCLCHGSFWSPAEFVKHAGGGDVAHPLKHIVVTPASCG